MGGRFVSYHDAARVGLTCIVFFFFSFSIG